jgi:hypothetical protein
MRRSSAWPGRRGGCVQDGGQQPLGANCPRWVSWRALTHTVRLSGAGKDKAAGTGGDWGWQLTQTSREYRQQRLRLWGRLAAGYRALERFLQWVELFGLNVTACRVWLRLKTEREWPRSHTPIHANPHQSAPTSTIRPAITDSAASNNTTCIESDILSTN